MTLNIKKERYKKTINEKIEISGFIKKSEKLKSKNEKYEIYDNSIEKNIFKKIDNKINKNFDKIMGTVTTLLVLLFIGGMIESKYKKSNKNEIKTNKIIIEGIEKTIGNKEEKRNEKIEDAKKMLEESLKDNEIAFTIPPITPGDGMKNMIIVIKIFKPFKQAFLRIRYILDLSYCGWV